ncbi:ArsR/SmtB family transcription factor [Leptospira stimsonii]|uniref:Transcriptional regulator n=1 Tax=Leptospira stimsonii TaxID=2202203 RepID=A0A4R9L9Z8_9LEPT|nr:metalloregulator ArsR/SmtB family transcription factor [Leptospira stimsonii]RHX83818.1 transcriptional regulator [Leptospira stimsonii]RHX87060.1 transcriptional regulator [Leptospira stimsonii]TGK18437.1 transcriptional regulator [Leptospira stimsonii]TGM21923.1 transcriptional regulator [Leptospira stimsonii]
MKKKKKFPFETEATLQLMSAISDPVKLKIAKILSCHREVKAGDIAKEFDISRTTISHHLNKMKLLNLVSSRKEGKEIYYSVDKTLIVDTLKEVVKFLEA